jgi:hypothetical protein
MYDGTGGELRFQPYADHLQFIVQDRQATTGIVDGDSWATAPENRRIAVEKHALAVATARYDYVPVVLAFVQREPPVSEWLDYDHVVEADLTVQSGELAVTGGTQLPNEVEPIRIPPGRYRVRVGYIQTEYRPAKSIDSEPGDYLEYRLAIWPAAQEMPAAVVKQGDSPWAY